MTQGISTVNLVLDVSTVSLDGSGVVTAVIFVDIDGTAFPENRWSDLVAGVIRGWIEKILGLAQGVYIESKLMFLDGPFWLRMTSEQGRDWTIECLSGHSNPKVECFRHVDLREFALSIISCAERLLDVYTNNQWPTSDDIDAIYRLIPQLKKALKS